MDAELYKAATRGNLSVLDETIILARGENYFLSKSCEENNIVHLAAQHGCADFITLATSRFPNQLALQQNVHGDTPLHVAVAATQFDKSHETVKVLISHLNNDIAAAAEPFFMVANKQGDTPFHVAIRNVNLQVAQLFLSTIIPNHPEILSTANTFKETPLHLFVRYCTAAEVNEVWMQMENNCCLMNMIRELLLPYADAACSHDEEGLTPLLRAARNGDVRVCHLLIEHSPQSAEVCDKEGRNVLHLITCSSQDYKDLKQLMDLPEISILKNRRDCQGNTPAHCSVFDRDLSKLRVLSESLADLATKNKMGLSVRDLISQEPDKNLKRTLERASMGRIMDEGLYKAAQECDRSVLLQQGDVLVKNDYRLCRQAHDGSNIIHLAIHGEGPFIEEVLKIFPTLIFQKNLNGDTPLHIAARLQTEEASKFLNLSCNDLWETTLKDKKLSFRTPPWMVKNSKGNILLHEAARTSNYGVISLLLKFMDLEDVSNVNDNCETSLHLCARYGTYVAANPLKEVEELVGKSSAAAYITDSDGLTPVSRASQCGRFRVAEMVLAHYPQSAKIPDYQGKIFLHHLKPSATELVDDSISIMHFWEEIFCFPVVDELRIVQDQDGNTPLHTAIINGNIAAIQFLMNRCLNSGGMKELSIINDHGNSVFQLLESEALLSHMKEMKELVTMTKSYVKERALERQKMDDNLYEMVIKGKSDILDPPGAVSTVIDIENASPSYEDRDFLRVTPDGSSILHIALKYSDPEPEVDFVEKALNRFPSLILQLDCNGDTPLHIAAKRHNPASDALVKRIKTDYERVWNEDRLQGVYVAPWKHKNRRGNMPIHEAIQQNNMEASNLLLDIHPDTASYVNDLGETPLHILARSGQSCIVKRPPDFCDLVKRLTTENISAAYMRDGEGLTPILRAAKSGRLGAIFSILELIPQAAYDRDPNGKSILHLLHFTHRDVAKFSSDDIRKVMKEHLFERLDLDAHLSLQDNDGDTALHSALKTSNSVMVDALVETILRSNLKDRRPLLNLTDKDGHTVVDLLASNEDHDTITRLCDIRGQYWRMDSHRVPEVATKDTIQSLSVVAGLLATITFSAAFQVPGGFDNQSGSPVALKKVAFKVFMVSDTIAMCASMMVLYCLVWAISSAKTKDRRLFLYLSMKLLLISFTATLLAFMTGVYAVTADNTLWLSILVCVLCSTTYLFRSRRFIVFIQRCQGVPNVELLPPGIGEPFMVNFVDELLVIMVAVALGPAGVMALILAIISEISLRYWRGHVHRAGGPIWCLGCRRMTRAQVRRDHQGEIRSPVI